MPKLTLQDRTVTSRVIVCLHDDGQCKAKIHIEVVSETGDHQMPSLDDVGRELELLAVHLGWQVGTTAADRWRHTRCPKHRQ